MKIRMQGPDPDARISIGSAPDADGCIEVPDAMLEQARAHGFVVSDRPVAPKQRPMPDADAISSPTLRRAPTIRQKSR